ncbi:hypothetical protein HMI56_004499 [Coelomomyces lativittatus]|nr:hypothetical protein HMI56_004499 [Coelomomyces lativittatus]
MVITRRRLQMDEPKTPTQTQNIIPILNTTPEQAVANLSVFHGERWDRWFMDFEAAILQFPDLSMHRKSLLLWSKLSTNVRERAETSRYNPTSEKSDYGKFKNFLNGLYLSRMHPKDRLWEFKDATERFSANKLTFCDYVTEFKLQYLKYIEDDKLTEGEDELIQNYFLSGLSVELRDSVAKELKGIKYPTAKQIITAAESVAITPFFSLRPLNKFNYTSVDSKHQDYSRPTMTLNPRRIDDSCIYCKRKGHHRDECNIMKDHIKRKLIIVDQNKKVCWPSTGKMINLLNYQNKSLADIVIQNTSRQEGTLQKPNLVKTTKIYNEDEEDYKSLDVQHIMQVMSSKPVNNFISTITVQMRNDAMKEVYEKFKSSQILMEVQYLLTNPNIVRFINEENRNLKTKYEQHAKVHEHCLTVVLK